jgi:ubiquinone/menaquinone biosynthesis C-methylase UbiE
MRTQYNSYNYPHYWQKRKYEHLAETIALKRLFAKVSRKNNLLDVGGGFGRLAEIYAPLFNNCLLIDPSEKLLKIAKKRLKKYKNIKVEKGGFPKLPVADSQIDCVLIVRVVHHLPQLEKAVIEIQRVLKPGGYLILEFANKIHGKSIIRVLLGRKPNYLLSHLPENISHSREIPFFNYHPTHIRSLLLANGFREIKTLSISNFRNPIFKKLIPLNLLLFLESILQPILSFFNFGPSIFILAQKKNL